MICIKNYLDKSSIELPAMNKQEFINIKYIFIKDLIANQPFVDPIIIADKISGSSKKSIIYVCQTQGKNIIIDGHHTVISEKFKGKTRIRCMVNILSQDQ